MEYTYDQMFQRNIGIFTTEEQEKIKDFKVAIAGAGGLGGEIAHLLTRLGVMNIKICDPEVFEITNINRQFGCYMDTIGQNKAKVVARDLKRINPSLNVEAFDYGINATNADEFIYGCDVVVDAIDFYTIQHSIELQDAARRQNKWVMTSQIVGSMVSTMNIKPGGSHYGDMFFENGKLSMSKVIKIFFPTLPKEATNEMVGRVASGEKITFPTWSHASELIAIFLLEDLVGYFIKNDRILLSSPEVTLVDLYNKRFIVNNV